MAQVVFGKGKNQEEEEDLAGFTTEARRRFRIFQIVLVPVVVLVLGL